MIFGGCFKLDNSIAFKMASARSIPLVMTASKGVPDEIMSKAFGKDRCMSEEKRTSSIWDESKSHTDS